MSASAARYVSSNQRFPNFGLHAALAGMPPEIIPLSKRVELAAEKGTGKVASKARESSLSPLWTDATRSGSDAAWARLPDRALQTLSEKREALPEDLTFLADAATRSSSEAVVVVRLLGCIGEERLAPERDIHELLLELLPVAHHRSVSR